MAKAIKEAEGGNKSQSVADIAATLLKQPPADDPNEGAANENDANTDEDGDDTDVNKHDVNDQTSNEEDDEDENDESPTGGQEDEEDADDAQNVDEDDEDEQSDDEDDDTDDETDYLDVTDDDLITVMVDEEEQEVSIGDLKRNFSLGKATEKRYQEATEARNELHAERTKALENFAAQKSLLETAFDGLDENFFKGIIPPPDESLKKTHPERYLQHKEAYDQEQSHIAAAKKALQDKRTEIENTRNEELKKYGEVAAQVIAQEIPELTKQETAQQTFTKLASTAQSYGYTPQEINSALDPRMFIVMRDLAKYHELLDTSSKRNPMDNEKQKAKKVRRIRSGNTNAKTRARQSDKRKQEAAERARKSGKVDDVAATLLQPAKKRR